MEPIKVINYHRRDGVWQFKIALGSPGDQTIHRVDLSEKYYQQLTQGNSAPDQLVIKSFEFLLEREPKESILPRFDLSDISRYFPEYKTTITSSL